MKHIENLTGPSSINTESFIHDLDVFLTGITRSVRDRRIRLLYEITVCILNLVGVMSNIHALRKSEIYQLSERNDTEQAGNT